MESLGNKLWEFLWKPLWKPSVLRAPARPGIRSGARAAPYRTPSPALRPAKLPVREFDLWRDVFVQQKLPWSRFLQSALLHAAAGALLWAISLSWMQQKK